MSMFNTHGDVHHPADVLMKKEALMPTADDDKLLLGSSLPGVCAEIVKSSAFDNFVKPSSIDVHHQRIEYEDYDDEDDEEGNQGLILDDDTAEDDTVSKPTNQEFFSVSTCPHMGLYVRQYFYEGCIKPPPPPPQRCGLEALRHWYLQLQNSSSVQYCRPWEMLTLDTFNEESFALAVRWHSALDKPRYVRNPYNLESPVSWVAKRQALSSPFPPAALHSAEGSLAAFAPVPPPQYAEMMASLAHGHYAKAAAHYEQCLTRWWHVACRWAGAQRVMGCGWMCPPPVTGQSLPDWGAICLRWHCYSAWRMEEEMNKQPRHASSSNGVMCAAAPFNSCPPPPRAVSHCPEAVAEDRAKLLMTPAAEISEEKLTRMKALW